MNSSMFLNAFLIALGGGAGALARYWLSALANRFALSHIALGTLVVNLLGCFIIGVFMAAFKRFELANELRLLVVTGFCGALTTFSTFSHESLQLLQASPWAFAANVAANLLGCFAMTFLGYLLIK